MAHKSMRSALTLKAPSKICSRRHSLFFYFSEKTSLDISCESSAKQTIHMKCQDLFSLKNNNKKKLSSAAVVIGALRIKRNIYIFSSNNSVKIVFASLLKRALL